MNRIKDKDGEEKGQRTNGQGHLALVFLYFFWNAFFLHSAAFFFIFIDCLSK